MPVAIRFPQTATRLPDQTQPNLGESRPPLQTNQTQTQTQTNQLRLMANYTELNDAQLEAISGGFLDATLGSSVLGDGMLCIGGGLINSKMELNL